jgi:hypothetical protein
VFTVLSLPNTHTDNFTCFVCLLFSYVMQSRYIKMAHTSYVRRLLYFFCIAFVSELLMSLENIPPSQLVNISDLYSEWPRFDYMKNFDILPKFLEIFLKKFSSKFFQFFSIGFSFYCYVCSVLCILCTVCV